ncbi:MAG: hypothetical protein A3H49_11900 [Nitrospirae bacterium RIFCSPLOWO2_02_FULL_62_14]|nr:MAG: hypothetical protein A3H49_11900 [Nitrospirae bacterium RIFCSPLOWO2_02_FULL_62_14]OGW68450.1 MAG: hypothetical protein A3A88_11050 [Nitrospirae bacterium RIFCSPLOWO2_01_FULL_62_17]
MKTEIMRKIVINTSFEDFCLSHAAFLRLRELGQKDALQEVDLGAYWPQAAAPQEPSLNRCGREVPRDDRHLVRVVEELGMRANGHAASLKIVEIPSDVTWKIEKVGGQERVSEAHRIWG